MKKTTLPRKQGGLTMISWMFVLAILVFFIMVGIKMVPSYMENYSVKQVLASMETDRSMRKLYPRELRKMFMRRLKINSVYEFKPEFLTIKKSKVGLDMLVDYEIRKPVVGNVFVVMTFDGMASIRKR